MKINTLVQYVHSGFEAWAAANKARLFVARDPFDVLEQLFAGPRGLLLCVAYAGGRVEDTALGEDDADGTRIYPTARERIEITVGHGLNLDAARDWRLMLGTTARTGLLEHVNAIRALALSFVFPDQGDSIQRLSYEGIEPLTTPEGFPLAAFRLSFNLLAAVDVDEDTELTL